MKSINLPQLAWHDPKLVDFPLPDEWDIKIRSIPGHDLPAMNGDEIRKAITSPMGMPPIKEIARGKKEVVIIFDDMTRTTQTWKIAPFILQELAEAGIGDNHIRFICALGTHQALDRGYLARKLGEDVITRYSVYNHCPFMNCTDLGTTSYGTPVQVNSEVMACDLKIGIGQITAHTIYGFNGGGKIIMPGVCSYDTILSHHGKSHRAWMVEQFKSGNSCLGLLDGNPLHEDAQEIARMAGLDMKIDSLINAMGETVAIYAGSLDIAYKAALEKAKSHYIVKLDKDSDIVIANSFAKTPEAPIAISTSLPALKYDGGIIVIIANNPMGQVVHYLAHNFGKTIGGPLYYKIRIPPQVKKVIFYTEYPEAIVPELFRENDKVMVINSWHGVIETLLNYYPTGAKVTVLPSADIQYSRDIAYEEQKVCSLQG
ncbi:MAG: DUF2088 domain-containing protein [Deltaproteobacteria bacterium]|nr:DUF2088 domain-containing protein [Deltaproteobacteria bacterium]